MSNFTDLLTELPDSVMSNTILNSTRTIVPGVIDKNKLYEKCRKEIGLPYLSPEKALYMFLNASVPKF